MPKITINTAGAFNPTNGSGSSSSAAGHMWITKPDETTIGYAPGGTIDSDGAYYQPGYSKVDIELTGWK